MTERCGWLTTEVAALREHYPTGGVTALLDALPSRSDRAIYAKAYKLGLRAPTEGMPRRQHPNAPHIDSAITAGIANCTGRNDVAALADRIGRPRWWVSKRATQLGLVVPRTRMPAWSSAEDALLREHAGKALRTIQRALARAGHARTETAIAVRMKRIGESRIDPDALSACGLAKMLGVDGNTVARWIASEGLPAAKLGTNRTDRQGGDVWSIDTKRLRKWIGGNAHLVDLRKVDRLWFIEMACGAAA